MITSSETPLKQRVLEAARQMPSRVRADARSEARTIVVSAGALSVGLFLLFDGLSHSAGRPPWFVAISLAIWAAVAGVSARGAWRWGGSFVPGSALQLATIAVGTPALLLSASLALARLSPGPVNAHAAAGGLPCLVLTLAAAIYPLTALTLLRRSTDPLHPLAGGAALGAASGAAAGVMVGVWCPVTDAAHVLSAHVAPVAALAVFGAVLGDRVLAMRVADAMGCACACARPCRRSREWKERVIAKRFVSCDVTPMGDRVAGSRSRSMGVEGCEGAGKVLAEKGIMIPDVRGMASAMSAPPHDAPSAGKR